MADDDSKVMTKGVFRSFVTDWYRKLKGAFNVEGTLTATKSDGTKAWELSQESAVLGTTEPAVKGTSQIGTAGNPFGSVWAGNLNNNAVTDSANPTLSVDGATSIIGALNQINSRLCNLIVLPQWKSPNFPYETDWLKLWIKHVVSLLDNTEPTIVIGVARPNSIRLVFAFFYDTKDFRDGMPQNAFGSYTRFDGTQVNGFSVTEGYFKGDQI